MKKIFAIALALVMVLGIATSAMAISWAAPTTSTSTSPFAAEVIKLGANSGVTGAEYYSVLTDAAAYDYANIFYAIKLSIPSASQANAAYSGAKYSVGDSITVNITYTNVSGKTTETKKVTIGSSAKTLWYNGKTGVFEESWVPSVSNACGCGDQHVIKATASGNKEVKVKVCFAAKGKLADIKIGGCYGVEEKEYCGIKPCVNCKPQDMKGFKFSGDCAKFPVFFATNAAGKVTGAYVIDGCSNYETDAYGSMKQITKPLYGWKMTSTDCGECKTCTTGSAVKFTLEELNKGTVIVDWASWDNNQTVGRFTDKTAMQEVFASTSCGVIGSTVKGSSEADIRGGQYDWVYIKNDDGTFTRANKDLGDITDGLKMESNLYRNTKAKTATTGVNSASTAPITPSWNGLTADADTNVATLDGKATLKTNFDDGRFMPGKKGTTNTDEKSWSKYYNSATGCNTVYGETYYFCYSAKVDQLFQQLTADKVSCDTNEEAYLNALNHIYQALGFTYADVAAGNVYMTKDILLANFGFAISPCSEAVWGAYTAAITVAAVAEVPATGSVTYVGFAMIVLAIAAAVATKKVRA